MTERNTRIVLDGKVIYDGPDNKEAIRRMVPAVKATYPPLSWFKAFHRKMRVRRYLRR